MFTKSETVSPANFATKVLEPLETHYSWSRNFLAPDTWIINELKLVLRCSSLISQKDPGALGKLGNTLNYLQPPTPSPHIPTALTSLWQDGGPVDGDVLKGYRSGFHDNPQTSHQSTPGQHQITRGRIEDTPINAVSNQVVVRRLWIYVFCWLKKSWTQVHKVVNEMRNHC